MIDGTWRSQSENKYFMFESNSMGWHGDGGSSFSSFPDPDLHDDPNKHNLAFLTLSSQLRLARSNTATAYHIINPDLALQENRPSCRQKGLAGIPVGQACSHWITRLNRITVLSHFRNSRIFIIYVARKATPRVQLVSNYQ